MLIKFDKLPFKKSVLKNAVLGISEISVLMKKSPDSAKSQVAFFKENENCDRNNSKLKQSDR